VNPPAVSEETVAQSWSQSQVPAGASDGWIGGLLGSKNCPRCSGFEANELQDMASRKKGKLDTERERNQKSVSEQYVRIGSTFDIPTASLEEL
jgi:hypothetical protein